MSVPFVLRGLGWGGAGGLSGRRSNHLVYEEGKRIRHTLDRLLCRPDFVRIVFGGQGAAGGRACPVDARNRTRDAPPRSLLRRRRIAGRKGVAAADSERSREIDDRVRGKYPIDLKELSVARRRVEIVSSDLT